MIKSQQQLSVIQFKKYLKRIKQKPLQTIRTGAPQPSPKN